MPIFDQGYQHWDGQRGGAAWRWLAISAQGIRAGAKSGGVRIFILFSIMPALMLVTALALWGLVEQGGAWAEGVRPLIAMFGFSGEYTQDPAAYRLAAWTIAFNVFLSVQTYFWLVVVMLTGPALISQDLRFNALPLYFSRPVDRFSYVLGKLGVIAVWIGGVTLLPLIIAYAFGVGFSFDPAVLRDTFGLLLGAIAYCLIVIASAGLLMLAISSMSRNTVVVGLIWIIFWGMTAGTSQVLRETLGRRPKPGQSGQVAWTEQDQRARVAWTELVSYDGNFTRLREELLGVEKARGGLPGSAPSAILPESTLSWREPAGVLACLGAVSVLILAWRIRGMDRLR